MGFAKMVGTITKVILERGFGFIRERGSTDRKEIFFHRSQLGRGLVFDEQLIERSVRFDVKHTYAGIQAVDIRPLD